MLTRLTYLIIVFVSVIISFAVAILALYDGDPYDLVSNTNCIPKHVYAYLNHTELLPYYCIESHCGNVFMSILTTILTGMFGVFDLEDLEDSYSYFISLMLMLVMLVFVFIVAFNPSISLSTEIF